MSITTKRGDHGHTDLLYGQRVRKNHPRLSAIGEIDELSAVLGLARAASERKHLHDIVQAIQLDLIAIMGLLAVQPEHYERYEKEGFSMIKESDLQRISNAAAEIEAQLPTFNDWVLPGACGNIVAAYFDHARVICRRAERTCAGIFELQEPPSPHLLPYLNRLSDYLWLLARKEELP